MPTDTPERRFYYVSIIDGKKRGLLAGPYDRHEEALAMVAPVRRMAQEANPVQAAFAAFGTAGSDKKLRTVFGKVAPEQPSDWADRLESDRTAPGKGRGA